MPVGPKRLMRRTSRIALTILIGLAAGSLVGCATERPLATGTTIATPNQAMLDPAQQALDTAIQANAAQYAPRSVGAARRRITLARDILFKAADAGRSLTSSEQERVADLVAAAKLDAREALVESQAETVQSQIAQLQGAGQGAADQSLAGDGSENAASDNDDDSTATQSGDDDNGDSDSDSDSSNPADDSDSDDDNPSADSPADSDDGGN